jgi:hypothetical protein
VGMACFEPLELICGFDLCPFMSDEGGFVHGGVKV